MGATVCELDGRRHGKTIRSCSIRGAEEADAMSWRLESLSRWRLDAKSRVMCRRPRCHLVQSRCRSTRSESWCWRAQQVRHDPRPGLTGHESTTVVRPSGLVVTLQEGLGRARLRAASRRLCGVCPASNSVFSVCPLVESAGLRRVVLAEPVRRQLNISRRETNNINQGHVLLGTQWAPTSVLAASRSTLS